MTDRTLYLKYRPQTVEELDSESVRRQLTAVVKSRVLPHAFLFAGPKGTGKTSAARILAKVVNCEKRKGKMLEPCNRCAQCKSTTAGNNLDVVEMDAASNRGIDEIRSLKEKIILSPALSRKKIYIIDEVHMLTLEAFNALLKTLEEPPEHVLFILATTDPERLPETIRSRVTQIVFARAKPEEILRQLLRVIKGEKLKIKEDVLSLIAGAADGSFRDAVKILEQIVINFPKPDSQKVAEFLFQTKVLGIGKLLTALAKKDIFQALSLVEEAVDRGALPRNLIDRLLSAAHASLLAKAGVADQNDLPFTQEELLRLVELLTVARREVGASPVAQLPLETALIKWCGQSQEEDFVEQKDAHTELVEEEKRGEKESQKPKPTKEELKMPTMGKLKKLEDEVWRQILTSVRSKNTTIEALLRAARPLQFDGQNLSLGVYYQFHKERLEAVENRRILEETCANILGNSVKIFYSLTQRSTERSQPGLTPQGGEDIIKKAEEIFGNV